MTFQFKDRVAISASDVCFRFVAMVLPLMQFWLLNNNNNNNNNNNTSYIAHLSITMISALRIKSINKIKTKK